MTRKFKIAFVVVCSVIGLMLLAKLLTMAFVEPWLEEKIETTLNEKYNEYKIDIDKVHVSFLPFGIELKTVLIRARTELENVKGLRGEIERIRIRKVNLSKFLSDKDIEIGEVKVINGYIKGEIPSPKEKKGPGISESNIRIDKIVFSNLSMAVKTDSSAQTYMVKNGTLNIYNINVVKKDTITLKIVSDFDFKAGEFVTVLADSSYTVSASEIAYTAKLKNLTVKEFAVQPNYSDYAFTARKKYQTDCIRAKIQDLTVHDISAIEFVKQQSLVCSYIEISKLNIHVFRDRRKEFQHVVKPMLQDMIYRYKGYMNIDSIGLGNANVEYVEHVESAVQPGHVYFNGINAKIYNISNDTVYRKKEGYLEVQGKGTFMGKGFMTVLLKSRIYEPRNTFTLSGSLSAMEAASINPMLEKNAFIFVTAGKVDGIRFFMRADKHKAVGTMTMLYHGLDVAIKSKKTNDTTALKEKLISIVANTRIVDSNPEPGEKVREGKIEYERDPEKFLFNYCFKSILSGLKASLSKPPKEKKRKKS